MLLCSYRVAWLTAGRFQQVRADGAGERWPAHQFHWLGGQVYPAVAGLPGDVHIPVALRQGSCHPDRGQFVQAFQRNFGRSGGNAAPATFVAPLSRKAASAGATVEILPNRLRLPQTCHGCGRIVKKPLALRAHQCACGVGPVQRDVYSAFLARITTATRGPSGPQWSLNAAPAKTDWAAAESRLSAASGVLSVQQFVAAGDQSARSVPGTDARLAVQAGGTERIVEAGTSRRTEALDAVPAATLGEPGRGRRKVPRTPRLMSFN